VVLAISTLPWAVTTARALAGSCIASQMRVTPADQLVAVPHRSRLRLAFGPAELLGALEIAFAQLLLL
jgi:hypothetical protein